jgi:hypothetical protein
VEEAFRMLGREHLSRSLDREALKRQWAAVLCR